VATNVSAQAPLRAKRSLSSYVMPTAATLLLGLLVLWLAVNFVKGPAYFFTIAFIGLTNGAVYALVALGYTLVYGILELINFAHGDVFMLGGMISATMLISVFGLTASSSTGARIALLLGSLAVAMAA
jgi:branched-chain amino acid transport system permease protein